MGLTQKIMSDKVASKLRILLTGASGFVGSHLRTALAAEELILVSRGILNAQAEAISIELNEYDDYSDLLAGVDVVIHLAARVHQFSVKNKQNEANKQIHENYLVTSNLVRQAKRCGVKRFIYISTIKVSGEQTFGACFDHNTVSLPRCAYGHSKLLAENKIIEVCEKSNMQYTIIRPPMVYGDKYKGNMTRLIKAVLKGIPLPFGNVNNKRSIISVRNLCDFIRVCVYSERAENKIFTIADEETISTTSLVNTISKVANISVRNYAVNLKFVSVLLYVFGKSGLFLRLYTDLEVDSSYARSILDWKQPYPQINELDHFIKDIITSKNQKM